MYILCTVIFRERVREKEQHIILSLCALGKGYFSSMFVTLILLSLWLARLYENVIFLQSRKSSNYLLYNKHCILQALTHSYHMYSIQLDNIRSVYTDYDDAIDVI